jgi:hypothetical protein
MRKPRPFILIKTLADVAPIVQRCIHLCNFVDDGSERQHFRKVVVGSALRAKLQFRLTIVAKPADRAESRVTPTGGNEAPAVLIAAG